MSMDRGFVLRTLVVGLKMRLVSDQPLQTLWRFSSMQQEKHDAVQNNHAASDAFQRQAGANHKPFPLL